MKEFVNNQDKHYKVALISDTHGQLRSTVLKELQGVDLIIHAGDVGSLEVLETLDAIAPVCAVRGNTDHGPGVSALPLVDCIQVGKLFIYVLHDLYLLNISPDVSDVSIVVSGHTHQPAESTRDNVLYINPGSIGPRRFDYPISMAFLDLFGDQFSLSFKTFDN